MLSNGLGLLFALSRLLPLDMPGGLGQTYVPMGEPGAFTFVRVEYDSIGGNGEAYYMYEGRWWQRWETDYPEAEQNFLIRMAELTTFRVNPAPISLPLKDARFFSYPMLYMCDVGWQTLSKQEIENLRAYLKRGGFLWVDDFWGHAEWQNFEENMQFVLPDARWREIPKGHAILNIVFPLEECPQVPAKIFWESSGQTFDAPVGHREPVGGIRGVMDVNFRGLFDKKNRLMVVATHNSDIGDGWEREAEDPEYFEVFSTKSYAIGINIVAYAMTH